MQLFNPVLPDLGKIPHLGGKWHYCGNFSDPYVVNGEFLAKFLLRNEENKEF
jgi:hypothetical protein